jgi:tRNA (cytidine/uridine-2'-O-)-methyltransferase
MVTATIRSMFHIVLVEPEIPPNTGNVIRLAANTGCTLHLIEPLGFSMEDRLMRRAGLDYHEYARCAGMPNWAAFLSEPPSPTRHAHVCHDHARHARRARHALQPGDWLVFGAETRGLPPELRDTFPPASACACPWRRAAQPEPVQRRGGDGVRGLAAEQLCMEHAPTWLTYTAWPCAAR